MNDVLHTSDFTIFDIAAWEAGRGWVAQLLLCRSSSEKNVNAEHEGKKTQLRCGGMRCVRARDAQCLMFMIDEAQIFNLPDGRNAVDTGRTDRAI